jgi:hypothetical protein
MKIYYSIFLLIGFSISCSKAQINNAELQKMYNDDQTARSKANIDWLKLNKADSLREKRVYQLLKSKQVLTAPDYENAALIFQHGADSVAYKMAVKMMEKAFEIDLNINRWLLAAATDRYLVSIGKPQIYGTQYYKETREGPFLICDLDTTKITDEERRKFNVPTLAEQKLKLIEMNRNIRN